MAGGPTNRAEEFIALRANQDAVDEKYDEIEANHGPRGYPRTRSKLMSKTVLARGLISTLISSVC